MVWRAGLLTIRLLTLEYNLRLHLKYVCNSFMVFDYFECRCTCEGVKVNMVYGQNSILKLLV